MRTFCKANARAVFVSQLRHVVVKHSELEFVHSMTTTTTPPGFVDITLDGQAVRVPGGTTVFDAARMNGINIPTLCHLQSQTPVGVSPLCVVHTGARVLAASCVRPLHPAMHAVTTSEKVFTTPKTL